ncbi:hypothetical protein HanIR_Chr12g0607351 [Helianthus annuus]|nr:hypothetical protein HanIR_Chr12g0607351 [Helianthus annuus]
MMNPSNDLTDLQSKTIIRYFEQNPKSREKLLEFLRPTSELSHHTYIVTRFLTLSLT